MLDISLRSSMNRDSLKPIVVVGSINTDMVVRSDNLPRAGETVLGGVFYKNQGGKGANQAVAASRLGASVRMIAKVGDDSLGRESVAALTAEGIDTSAVMTDPKQASGVALILVDAKGENVISVASGANLSLRGSEVEQAAETIRGAAAVLMQLEIPLGAVAAAARMARRCEVPVILNPAPAPAAPLPAALLADIDILVPNQTEAEMISGVSVTDFSSAERAARKIGEMGVQTVIITMGAMGVFLYQRDDSSTHIIHAQRVSAVDSTAAGDCFCGALSVALSEGRSLLDAIGFANRAAAISVTRRGAQPSLPTRAEVDAVE